MEDKKDKSKYIRPELYWEYRCTIEELKVAQLNEKRTIMERDLKRKDIELLTLKLHAFGKTVTSASSQKEVAKKELDRMRSLIESEIGMELTDCVIDDVSFEVRKIDEPVL